LLTAKRIRPLDYSQFSISFSLDAGNQPLALIFSLNLHLNPNLNPPLYRDKIPPVIFVTGGKSIPLRVKNAPENKRFNRNWRNFKHLWSTNGFMM
jgi:hypothetical protein